MAALGRAAMTEQAGERHDWKALREDYSRGGLGEDDLAGDPFEMFHRWLADAIAAELPEPNAMVIATASPAGTPAARYVLLKGVTDEGFTFFTNVHSRKGEDLRANPACALLFPWHPLQRQVRVEGSAMPLPDEAVSDYFATRPRGARLGAWASRQSRVVTGRAELEQAYADAESRFGADDADRAVPVPPEWGGYLVRPERFEFWQGRRSRLHDRMVYRRDEAAVTGWTTYRLAP